MLGLLIFVSFILHAVAFYWIFILKRRLKEPSEIEDVLAVYMEDMREQNDQWIRFLKDFQTGGTGVIDPGISSTVKQRTENKPGMALDFPPVDFGSSKEHFESSFEGQVFSLNGQGLNHEEIAKKLGRGKGEVELLLRLAKSKQK